MYVPKRKPAAHTVAAKQGRFDGCHLYVESGSDARFWRYFVDENNVMLHACDGWPEVVNTIQREVAKGIMCIGIIDNDFRNLTKYPEPLPDNVFTTDDHDVEMMALKTEAARRVVTHYDASRKLAAFERQEGDLMEFVWGISDSIGLLKLANHKNHLNIVFKKVDRNQNIELPGYENFLDSMCHYISDARMIRYLCSWSGSQGKTPNKNDAEIMALTDAEKRANHDTMQLSCGHDACYVLARVIEKRITNKRKVTQEDVESYLSVAYQADDLQKTELYEYIEGWSQGRGVRVLKS